MNSPLTRRTTTATVSRRRRMLRGAEQLEPRALLAVAPLPTVSIADARVVEGNYGTRSLAFVVSLSSAATQTTTVQFQTLDGTATTADADYTAASGTLTFRSGQRTATATVAVRGDTRIEADEAFQVMLSNPTNATLGRSTATGTILDDDDAPRTVSVAGPATPVAEGGTATFTFTLSRAASTAVSVGYATRDVTTAAGADYTAVSGSLTFAAGETTKAVTVATLTDSTVESDESFQMRISSVSGASVGVSTALATIADVPPVTPPPTPAGGAWTILVYMTGENLNTDAKNDINEMEKFLVGAPAGVKIVVSWDQPKSGVGTAYATGGGTQSAWRTYGRSVLKADSSTTTIASTFDLSFGEKNTGSPATLVDFVKWGVAQAPAQRYVLQMWGHGGGTDGSQFDSESADDALTLGEMGTALATAGMPKFDIVSYDNCLMQMAEVGAAVAPNLAAGGAFVASEESINGSGQDYTTAYSALKVADPAAVTVSQVIAGMTASYWNQYKSDGVYDTFSGVLASATSTLQGAIKQFVDSTVGLTAANRTTILAAANASVGFDVTSFRDLGKFVTGVAASTSLPQAVRDAATGVRNAIAAAVASKTPDARGTAGISIYLPTTSTDAYLGTYATDAAAFCQATGWNTFAKWLATGTRSTTTAAMATWGQAVRAAGRDFPAAVQAAAFRDYAAVTAAQEQGAERAGTRPRVRAWA